MVKAKLIGISIGAVILIVIIAAVISNTSKTVKKAIVGANFIRDNTVSRADLPPATITESQAKGYAGRIMNDLSYWGWEFILYAELTALNDSSIIMINNSFVANYSEVYDYEYTNIGSLIKSEDLWPSPESRAFQDRCAIVLPNFSN